MSSAKLQAERLRAKEEAEKQAYELAKAEEEAATKETARLKAMEFHMRKMAMEEEEALQKQLYEEEKELEKAIAKEMSMLKAEQIKALAEMQASR